MCETSPTSWDSGRCLEYVQDYSLFGRDQSVLAHAYLELTKPKPKSVYKPCPEQSIPWEPCNGTCSDLACDAGK